MKRINTSLFAFLCLFTAYAQQKSFTYEIKGKLNKAGEPIKYILTYKLGKETFIDSAISNDGKFTFRGKLEEPVKAFLMANPLNGASDEFDLDMKTFFIEKGEIVFSGSDSLHKIKVKAGKVEKDYEKLQEELLPLEKEMEPISSKMHELYKDGKMSEIEILTALIREIKVRMKKVEEDFIRSHPDSYVSLDLVKDRGDIIEPVTFTPVYNALSWRMRNTATGKKLGERLAIARRTAIGQPAIEFTQQDRQGVPVSLSSLKNKYVFIDFWASWCAPCRAENPFIKKAYEKFKSRNFEVIAVSLDDKKDPWIKAIEKDGLPWIHVSNLKGFKSTAAIAYGVTAIPQNFLIDPNGVIIAKNLRGDELEKMLEKLLGS